MILLFHGVNRSAIYQQALLRHAASFTRTFILNLGFFDSAVCAVGTTLHGQPSAIGQCWLCSTSAPWLCRNCGTSGNTGLAVCAAWLPDSFPAVAVLSGAVPSKYCVFPEHRSLHALPMDTPEFSSTWQLGLRGHAAALAELGRLRNPGQVQNSSSSAKAWA